MARKKKVKKTPEAESYQHPTAETLLRPEVGTQAQFRKKKPTATYRYDSSLDPAMSWDEGNAKMKNSKMHEYLNNEKRGNSPPIGQVPYELKIAESKTERYVYNLHFYICGSIV